MEKTDFFLFYRGPLSQWHKCEFKASGIKFNCAEQYMMYHKALVFGDLLLADKIMSAKEPSEQKQLGRGISAFDEKRWIALREGIVFSGNYAKFQQNEDLKNILFDTKDKLLAEASPSDKIWGIGLAADDIRARNMYEWKGLNLLGIALTRVREVLLWEQRRSFGE